MRAVGFMLGFALLAQALAAQTIRGRIVDADSRQGIRSASVIIRSTTGNDQWQTVTNANGFFTVRVASAGSVTATIQHTGYTTVEQQIALTQDTTLAAIVLTAEAVKLDSLKVAATSAQREYNVGFKRSSALLAGTQMARLERTGAKPITAMGELSGIHLRSIGNFVCVEATRRMAAIPGSRRAQPNCQAVLLVIDNVPAGDPYANTRSLNINEIESMEYLPPVEAGHRYGMDAGAVGAIVIWTRGRGPHRSAAREVK